MKPIEMYESSIGEYYDARDTPRAGRTVMLKPVAIARSRTVDKPVTPKVGMNWSHGKGSGAIAYVIVDVEPTGRVWYYRREIGISSVASTANPPATFRAIPWRRCRKGIGTPSQSNPTEQTPDWKRSGVSFYLQG